MIMTTKQDLEISILRLQVSVAEFSEKVFKDQIRELRRDLDKIKEVILDKLGIKIAIQG